LRLNFRDRFDEDVCFCDEIIKTPTRYGIAARIDDNSGFNKINSAYAPLYRVCDCLITGHALWFADEARFGRINRPRPCWAPIGTRPEVASQLIREYIYLYGAVCPKDGTCVYLLMPMSNTACFQIFLNALSRKFARQDILSVPTLSTIAQARAAPRNYELAPVSLDTTLFNGTEKERGS
jgi:hypothetical protein